MITAPTFWWDGRRNVSGGLTHYLRPKFGRRNFGDRLTEHLFPDYGLDVVWARPVKAQLCGIGSILQHLPADSRAIILGSGFQSEFHGLRTAGLTAFAVRGRLSENLLGLRSGETVLGDPGLLIEPAGDVPETFTVGLTPHYVDKRDARIAHLVQRHCGRVKLIDIEQKTVEGAIRDFHSCEVILSSSLHGIIAAWALGKPAGWIELSKAVKGSGFKFRDAYSAFDLEASPRFLTGEESLSDLCKLASPPPAGIDERRAALADALRRAVDALQTPVAA